MKTKILLGIVTLAAARLLAADSSPKDEITAAAKKVAQKDVYAWRATNDFNSFISTADGKADKEGLIWLAGAGSEPVGFLLALPDYNIPIQPLKGRLLTPKLLGFIPYVLGWKCPPRTRVLTLGVKEKYRGKGLESAMLIEGLRVGIEAGVTESEASWILEDNEMM